MQNADVYAPPECAVELPVPTVRSTAYVGDLVIKAQIDATLGSRLSMRIGRHVHVGWERTGRLSWLSDLAQIPEKYGVTNVYGDLGAIFAWNVIAQPVLAAAMMGTLVKGLGHDHVIWGTDSVWTGSPQWQIEGLRRLEIPEDMQKQHGFTPLGPADGPVKTAILGQNGLRLFAPTRKAGLAPDALSRMKAEYEKTGPQRSNLRYGFVHRAT